MTSTVTSPADYPTNTDESDALAFNMGAELGSGESIASAACELWRLEDHEDVSAVGFPSGATITTTVVTQPFDARVLTPGPHHWIWKVTLNTGAVRSYRTVLHVENHD